MVGVGCGIKTEEKALKIKTDFQTKYLQSEKEKKMKGKICVLLIALLVSIQQIGYAKIYCKIKGRVLDEETGKGIHNVNVQAHYFFHDSPQTNSVLTDEKGYFTFSNITAGRYRLNYVPLYPYVLSPARGSETTSYNGSFVLEEGEIKYVEKKLKKGGRLVVNFSSTIFDTTKTGISSDYIDRIENGNFIYDFEFVSHKWHNPAFKKTYDGKEFSGLSEGQYITNLRPYLYGDYGKNLGYNIVGIPQIFNISKMQDTVLNIEFNSNSWLILNIVDVYGNKLNRGRYRIFKKVTVKNKNFFYCVFRGSFSPLKALDKLEPLLIEPGDYLIKINAYALPKEGEDKYSVDSSDSNYFHFSIGEKETKNLKCIIVMNDPPEPIGLEIIHY